MRKIETIHIHYSATDYAHHDNIAFIRKVHVKERKWSDIGYNYFIDKKGGVFIGRPISRSPASIKGYNFGAVAICVSGLTGITEKQKESLIKLVQNLVTIFGITEENILRHRDLADTLCPSFDINFLKEALNYE